MQESLGSWVLINTLREKTFWQSHENRTRQRTRIWSVGRGKQSRISKAVVFLLSSLLTAPSQSFLSSPCLSFGERERDDMKLQQLSAEPFLLNLIASPEAELLASCCTSHQAYLSSHNLKPSLEKPAERPQQHPEHRVRLGNVNQDTTL